MRHIKEAISLRKPLRHPNGRSGKALKCWSEWQDLNLRPPRPERGALPDCATLRLMAGLITSSPHCRKHGSPATQQASQVPP